MTSYKEHTSRYEAQDLKPVEHIALDIAASYDTVITSNRNMYAPKMGCIYGHAAQRLIELGYIEVVEVNHSNRVCKITEEGKRRVESD